MSTTYRGYRLEQDEHEDWWALSFWAGEKHSRLGPFVSDYDARTAIDCACDPALEEREFVRGLLEQ